MSLTTIKPEVEVTRLPDGKLSVKCPVCGAPMHLRTNQSTQQEFWGCSQFRSGKCKKSLPVWVVQHDTPAPATSNGASKSLQAELSEIPLVAPTGHRNEATAPTPPAVLTRGVRVPSVQQETVIRMALESDSHIAVRARAGTGKSTTAEMIYQALMATNPNLSITYVAFNTHNADEFRARGIAGAMTLHSFGLKILQSAVPGVSIDKAGDKVQGMIEELTPRRNKLPESQTRRGISRLVSLCKFNLLNGTKDEILALIAHHDIDLPAESLPIAYRMVPKILNLCKERTTVADFDDMIWLPCVLKLPTPRMDVMLVDEAQDLNLCQMTLVVGTGARIIAFGDDRQAIYGFTGAEVDGFTTFARLLGATPNGVETAPLTVTRRCAQAVVREAQLLVPDYEAHPDNVEGLVDHINVSRMMEVVKAGDIILCRTTAPLVSMAYKLIEAGTPANIRNRDIGEGLKALVRKLRATSIPELAQRLEEYNSREVNRLSQLPNSEMAMERHSDKMECIRVFLRRSDNLTALNARIDEMFGNKVGAVLLSTVHSIKGLEANNVFILKPGLLPHPRAKQSWQHAQEMNAKYVAITRAKKELHYVHE